MSTSRLKKYGHTENANKYIFFNADGIVETLNQSEIMKSDVINLHVAIDGTLYYSNVEINNFNRTEFANRMLLIMTYCQLKNGDTIEDLKRYYHNSSITSKEPLKEIDYFVTRICQLNFVRTPENQNPNTFDYIYVEVNLAITWKYDKNEYFIKNKKAIDKMIIKNSQSFQKYNIPINFLKLARISFKNQKRIVEYVFELKEI